MSTSSSADATPVVSPCIRVCSLDAADVCIGCGRTLDEIVAWSKFSIEQQRGVCERAQQRRQQRRPA